MGDGGDGINLDSVTMSLVSVGVGAVLGLMSINADGDDGLSLSLC